MNRVKELRRRAGLQQKELALMVGVTRPTMSEWESGKRNPSQERLMKLSEIFNVSTGVVLGYEPVPSPVPVLFVDDGTENPNIDVANARELVRREPERSVLFSMATKANITNVRRAIAILKALESSDNRIEDV